MFKRLTVSLAASLAIMPLLLSVAGVGGILCLSSGCGGGDSSTPEKELPLSSRTRALQPGDSWTYRVSGNSDFYGKWKSSLTETVRIDSGSFMGNPVLTRTTITNVEDTAGYGVEYLKQTETGELIALGALGLDSTVAPPDSAHREVRPLIEPQPFVFGEWIAKKELTYQLQYNDQDFVARAAKLVIVGTEKVSTPLGTFDTWKVEVTPNNPRTLKSREGTYWYAPQLGAIVKEEETVRGFEQYDNVTRILVETNVPLSVSATSVP